MITVTGYFYTVLYYYFEEQVGFMKSDHKKCLVKLTVITLSGFHCNRERF